MAGLPSCPHKVRHPPERVAKATRREPDTLGLQLGSAEHIPGPGLHLSLPTSCLSHKGGPTVSPTQGLRKSGNATHVRSTAPSRSGCYSSSYLSIHPETPPPLKVHLRAHLRRLFCSWLQFPRLFLCLPNLAVTGYDTIL